jgi:CheY-like chemotaxis protein
MARRPALSHNTILLIEDDESIREVTEELLRAEGYDVTVTANGKEALETLRSMNPLPKLILLDLMMPVMDGWQFMEMKRLDSRLNAIPVVAFSALEERKISAAQTDDVIRKPINPSVMIKIIKKYCSPENES